MPVQVTLADVHLFLVKELTLVRDQQGVAYELANCMTRFTINKLPDMQIIHTYVWLMLCAQQLRY